MNRTFMLAFLTFLSLSMATAAAAETVQKQKTEKSAAAKPKAAAPAATKPLAAKSEEENSVLLDIPLFSSFSQEVPIASVDDEIISLRELNESFSSLHEKSAEENKTASKIDYKTILNRLINVTLINMEARDMELEKLPEVQDALKKNADGTLRDMLKERQTQNLTPDKALVEKYYKEATKEYKIKSVIFAKEDDAKKMASGVKGGKDFDGLAKKALADKTANGSDEGQYMRADQLLPQVAAEVGKLKAGGVTPVIKVQSGYTIMKMEGVRYAEDATAKKGAEEKALNEKTKRVLKDYFAGLKKRYAVVNQKLFKGLNFETNETEFSKLLKDKRPLVKIKGEKPITVGEFTDAINMKFFHGVKRAIEEKKVNILKDPVLDEMLYKRLSMKEAKALGIDSSDEYKNSLERYKRSVLFVTFIEKAIVPDIKVTEGESKKYYEEHISDYTYPEMVKLYSLGFYKVTDASDTLKKLQQGTDFAWIKSNASGQIKEGEPGALLFDGDIISVTGLDEGLKKALTGVKTGDYRLYSDGKFSYVINVREDIPSKKQDYKEARETTVKKVFNEKLNQSVQDWAGKLRKAHKVKVYITGIGTTKTE